MSDTGHETKMATKSSSGNHGDHSCLMCLDEHDSLKILTSCKHVFCCKCLRSHQQSLGKNSFCCPTCQAACPLPGGDIAALLDYNGDNENDDAEGTVNGERFKTPDAALDQGKSKRIPCDFCAFSKTLKIDAENLCEECGNLHLCKDCTAVHGENKATADHVMISLKKHKEGHCKAHKKRIHSYCTSCVTPCCPLCVMFDHRDHKVEKIGHVFHSLVEELTTIAEDQERRSSDLKRYKDQLRYLEGTEMTKRRDILIQATEDQAEKCIAHIIQQKDDQIKKIRDDYKDVTGVLQCLDRVAGLGVLDTTVAKAKVLLAEVETHPADIRQLSSVKQDILDLGIKEDIDIEGYWETYRRSYDNPVQFIPTDVQSFRLGTIQVKQPPKRWDLAKCKSVFEKAMPVDNAAKYIPYVANLGNNFYAIAHPIIAGGRSEAVDIYKFPGELQRTLRDHINPLIDMVATWVGQLAVLSKGTAAETCAVHLFDPKTGFIRSTKDLAVNGPLSFDVNSRCEYVILSNDGEKKVTILKEDGSVVLASTLGGASNVSEPCRVRCRGAHFFVMGVNYVFAIYKRNEKEITLVTTNSGHLFSPFVSKDISVSSFNPIIACDQYPAPSQVPYFREYSLVSNQVSAAITSRRLGIAASGANLESRLAVRDNYMVFSQGQTIRVYESPEV